MIRVTHAILLVSSLFFSNPAGAKFAVFRKSQPIGTVSVEQVYQLLCQQDLLDSEMGHKPELPSDFVLVDVRSPEEQAVSMIPGAITSLQFEEHKEQYRGKKIIAYCTVGARSEKFARELNTAGYAALNFKESIVGWCHAEHPLVTQDGQQTRRVHTYSAHYKVPPHYTAVY